MNKGCGNPSNNLRSLSYLVAGLLHFHTAQPILQEIGFCHGFGRSRRMWTFVGGSEFNAVRCAGSSLPDRSRAGTTASQKKTQHRRDEQQGHRNWRIKAQEGAQEENRDHGAHEERCRRT
jgi:hypothetical protein